VSAWGGDGMGESGGESGGKAEARRGHRDGRFAYGVAWLRRRLAASQVMRRSNWLSQMNRDGAPLRIKEGDAARWNGRPVADAGGGVRCADAAVPIGTRVYVQGGCDATSGSHVLRDAPMRAELGAPFSLAPSDFPLRLSVAYVNASLRGEEAYSAHQDPQLMPRVYASFHTPEIDMNARYLLWIGVPVTYFLLSCCCCCWLCFCCAVPNDAGGAHRAIREHELADLSTVQQEPQDDDDDDDEEFDSLRRAREKPSKNKKGGARGRSKGGGKRAASTHKSSAPRGSIDDEIVPA
jgi:hypothetical protein